MANAHLKGVVRNLCRLLHEQETKELTDQQMLQQFCVGRDQAAFAALVRRHGGLVLWVCRRVLGNEQDAEDAFQAAFLVLARKAGSIRNRKSLASWLYGVAYRTAMTAKRNAGRRRRHEQQAAPTQPRDPSEEVSWREVETLLNEEIHTLPDKLRSPFILCVLEGKKAKDAGAELGLKEGTIWSRLNQARTQLRQRLARRGLSLSMILAATVSGQTAAAVPPSLLKSTLETIPHLAGGKCVESSTISTQVQTLAEEVGKAMFTSKMKAGILCLIMTGVIALSAGAVHQSEVKARPGGVAAHEAPGPNPEYREQFGSAQAEKDEQPARLAMKETKDSVILTGRVLDPEGKPVGNAKFSFGWWQPFALDWFPWIVTAFAPDTEATSGPDGSFQITLGKKEIFAKVNCPRDKPWQFMQVVAWAEGYGPGFVTLEAGQKDLTIHLVRDDIPIRGRVLDLEGRPVEDATVSIDHIAGGQDWHRILFARSWAGMPEAVTTDGKGRFTLKGIGRDRKVLLHVRAPRVEHTLVEANTRTTEKDAPPPSLNIVVGPSKPIEGTVVENGTNKPLAGMIVYGNRVARRGGIQAITDKQGRYQLHGLAKARTYHLEVYPPSAQPYLAAEGTVEDTAGLEPIRADFSLRRGIPVRLEVVDRQTGEPVRGVVRYSPLLGNPHHSEAIRPASNWASSDFVMPDRDHCYNFVAFPGPGIIYAWVGHGKYLPASFSLDPADEKIGYGMRNSKDPLATGWLDIVEGYRIINPESGDNAMSVKIKLDPGVTLNGVLVGPDSRPVKGALAYGLDYNPKSARSTGGYSGRTNLPSDTFTATTLHPRAPRTVSFLHAERKLAGHAMLRGDEKAPLTVPLQPWGEIKGRLLDADGKPVRGIRVRWLYPTLPAPGMMQATPVAVTDEQGRFHLTGVLPGPRFNLMLSEGKPPDAQIQLMMGKWKPSMLSAEALNGLNLRPGEVKDLGDVRVQRDSGKKQDGGSEDE